MPFFRNLKSLPLQIGFTANPVCRQTCTRSTRACTAAMGGNWRANAIIISQGGLIGRHERTVFMAQSRQFSGFRRSEKLVHFDPIKKKGRKRFSPEVWLKVVPVVVIGFSVVYFTHLETVEATNRRRFVWFSTKTEERLGTRTNDYVLETNKRNVLPQYHPATKYIKKVGERIVKANGLDRDQWEHVKWEWNTIHDKTPNAMVAPGGKVIVYTGILKMCQNEDDLAVILAHEIGHTIARHAAERLTRSSISMLISFCFWLVTGEFLALTAFMSLFWTLPNSRLMESEADKIGLQLMTRACYNPSRAPVLFSNLPSPETGSLAFLSTHPKTADRVKDLSAMVPEWRDIFENSCSPEMRKHFMELRAQR